MSNSLPKSRLNGLVLGLIIMGRYTGTGRIMERTTFLEHYRIRLKQDGTPRELGRTGPVITYKAVDERTGETVALKLIPLGSIDPATREQFEEEARAAARLNHINIAKVFDVGHDDGHFVYASEYVPGEMLDSWVAEHGPMPADAVLRVAMQIVSALSSANFHRLTLRAIQPSNLIIVPGSTPEGDWPFVKLMNFGLAGLKSGRLGETDSSRDESKAAGSESEESFSLAPQFASPEQLRDGRVDFRSEIYSLGATMYFLLTGVAPRVGGAEVRRKQLRVFPKALRNLLGQMLRQNPDQRPKDLVALAEMIRECLLRVERRQGFARRFGIPLAATIPGKPRTGRSPLVQVGLGALAVAVLLLAATVAGSFLLPDLIPLWHRTTAADKLGVQIGVPDESSTEQAKTTSSPPVVANQSITDASPGVMDSNQNPAPQTLSGQTSNTQAEATPTNAASPNVDSSTQVASGAGISDSAPSSQSSSDQSGPPENSAQAPDNSSAQTSAASQPTTAGQSASRSKKKEHVASTSQRRAGSMRARVVGFTSDGRLIFRLPSGRTAIVAPDSEDENEPASRPRRRAFIERDETFAPRPQFEPDYSPYD